MAVRVTIEVANHFVAVRASDCGRAPSDAFASCQVQKVFKNVCFRAPSDSQDRARVQAMTASFKASGYQLKRVFAEAATYCMGD